jgi:O-antigen ligase
MVAITWIPCCIGIAEWIACMNYGYEETMHAVYGAAAQGATQNFAYFDLGGTFFRIPSTFTFVTQFSGYTLAMIVPAYILARLDPSAIWRKFAFAMFWLAILASFMSGARAAYLFVPILLVLIYLLDSDFTGVLKIVILLPLAMLAVMAVTGINPEMMYALMVELFLHYSDELAETSLLDAISAAPFGTGTGMNTGPARYAFDDQNSYIPVESYYAKTVIELGIAGLLIVVAIFIILMIRGYGIHRKIRNAGIKSCSAAFLAFIITMVLHSFKGWQIDLDPVNVYFWVFSGFLLKLGWLEKTARALPVPERSLPNIRQEFPGEARSS